MFELSSAGSVPTPRSITDPASVLCVGADSDVRALAADAIRDDDRLAVRTAAPDDALARVADADCVVSETALPDRDVGEFLAAVRDRDDAVPFLAVGDAPDAETLRTVLDREWTDVVDVGVGETPRLLTRRVRRLVGHRRTAALASRSLAAVDTAADGIGIVAPDGTVEFANRPYATRFGYEASALPGTDWRSLYTDDAVDRLESAALPTVSDGWRWSGNCTGHRADGATFETRMDLVGLDDGSLVISHPDSDAAQG